MPASLNARKMFGVLNQSVLSLMTSLGHRTGLFGALACITGRATAHQIAAEARLNERCVREWLGVMVSGGVVEYDDATRTYRLSPERGIPLPQVAALDNLNSAGQWMIVSDSTEDELVKAFTRGPAPGTARVVQQGNARGARNSDGERGRWAS